MTFTAPIMGRVEHYLVDSDRPARAPAAVSRRYAHVGAVLRHGFDTANETHLHLLSTPSPRSTRPRFSRRWTGGGCAACRRRD